MPGLPAHKNSEQKLHPRESEPSRNGQRNTTGPCGPGEASADCRLLAASSAVSQGNPSQDHLVQYVLNSPPTEMETTNVYCFRLTWKGRNSLRALSRCGGRPACGVQFQRAVMLPTKALGTGLSAALDSATSQVCDVSSALEIYSRYFSFFFWGRWQNPKPHTCSSHPAP